MMVMAAALAKLILPSVMMTSKFWWRATTWQSDDWFQMQGTVKRGHLMAMKLPKGPPGARHHPGRQRTAREQSATILLPNSRILGGTGRYDAVLWDQKTPNIKDFLGRHATRTD